MLTFKSHAEALDLLSSLTHNLYPLAAQGTPEDRVEAFEHADFLRRYFDYFDADFKAQLPCFPEVGPAADALHGQIRELGLLLAQVDEITVFWDTGIFVNDPEVPGTPSSSSSSSDSVFSRPSSVPRRVRPDRPEPIITPQEHLISMLFSIVRTNMAERRTQQPLTRTPQSVSQGAVRDLQNQITVARSEISDAVSHRSRTPASATRQLQDQAAEIERLNANLSTLQAQLSTLQAQHAEEMRNKEIQLSQAIETIAVHSGEMSKLQTQSQKYQCQPFQLPSQIENASHGQHQAQSAGSTFPVSQGYARPYNSPAPYSSYNQQIPPPPGLGFGDQGMLTTKWGVLTRGPSSPYQQADPFTTPQSQARLGTTAYGSPLLINQLESLNLNERVSGRGGNGGFTTPPRQTQATMSAQRKRPDTPAVNQNQGALVPFIGQTKEAKMKQSFQGLIDEAVTFGYKYVNTPSTQGDSNMPGNLKEHLLDLATKTTANRIMSNQNSRYFLVGKMILNYLITDVLGEGSFAGFDREIDNAIEVARSNIFGNTPAAVRKVYLQEIAKQFSTLKSNENFEQFVSHLIYKRATELWSKVRPLMYVKRADDWTDMLKLVTNAHKLAISMLTDDTEFKLEFTATNIRFHGEKMVNMDPEYRDMPAQAIMAAGGLVRLGAVPEVAIRVTSADGHESIQTLVKAGVLIAFPQKK